VVERSDWVMLGDGDLLVRSVDGDDEAWDEELDAFEIVWEGEQIGRIELLRTAEGDGDLVWTVVPEYAAVGVTERALRLVVDWAVGAPLPDGSESLRSPGLARVEARVPDSDRDAVRSAIRAGLRKEGIERRALVRPGRREDVVVLARVADDPAPDSREGFIGLLNSTLPTKRAIAQGVLRDESGRILLCELTYKAEWDLPGGVVDPSESPAACVVREVREELGLDVSVQGLLAVNWLPPWRGWSDAVAFIFDLGVVDAEEVARATLQRREIRATHFVGDGQWAGHVAPYNERLLDFLTTHAGPTAYLEDSRPVGEVR
jgi:8-oxo-dGTP pyrophosphatase MutT (NUDIX family)